MGSTPCWSPSCRHAAAPHRPGELSDFLDMSATVSEPTEITGGTLAYATRTAWASRSIPASSPTTARTAETTTVKGDTYHVRHPAKATAEASGASANPSASSPTRPARPAAPMPTSQHPHRKVIAAVHDVIRRHEVTYEEYNALKGWLISVGQDGEWPLVLTFESTRRRGGRRSVSRKREQGTIEDRTTSPARPPCQASAPCRCATAEPGTPLPSRARSPQSPASRCPERCWSCG